MIGQVIVGQWDFLSGLLDDPVRIAIADKEALEFCGLSIVGMPDQYNAAGLFA